MIRVIVVMARDTGRFIPAAGYCWLLLSVYTVAPHTLYGIYIAPIKLQSSRISLCVPVQ